MFDKHRCDRDHANGFRHSNVAGLEINSDVSEPNPLMGMAIPC